jgi:hypothetical protein
LKEKEVYIFRRIGGWTNLEKRQDLRLARLREVTEKSATLEWLQMQRFRVTGNAAVQVPEKAAVGVAEKSATQSGCKCKGLKSLKIQQFKSLP